MAPNGPAGPTRSPNVQKFAEEERFDVGLAEEVIPTDQEQGLELSPE
jgi:hypothetical protein